MTRETSIEAYEKIKASGLIGRRQREVYDVLFWHGPMTSAEAFVILNEKSPVKNITQSRARFTELRDFGVIEELGRKTCSVTKHSAIEWRVTGKMPIPKKKRQEDPCPACNGTGWVGYHKVY